MVGGMVSWLVLAVATAFGVGDLELRLLVVLSAPLVIVPRSLRLLAPSLPPAAGAVWVIGAGMAASSALVPVGALAALLACGWLAATASLVAMAATTWWRDTDRRLPAEQVLAFVALAWLPAAAAWFVASRAGAEPFGFDEPITLLTSAHFHVAGHATTAIAAVVLGHLPAAHMTRRVALGAAGATTIGPVLVAAGWQTGVAMLHVAGATLLTVGIAGLVPGTFAATSRGTPPVAVRMARVGALVPAVPLAFAMLYSLARVSDLPMPSIDVMVRAHGLVNALGFAALSLEAWRRMRAVESNVPDMERRTDVVAPRA